MKPRPLVWLAVTAAAAAAVMCWHLLTMEPDPAPLTAREDLSSAEHVTGNGAYSTPETPLPKFGTPEFKTALRERGMEWLNARGRDATGLITMFDLTGEYMLLEEAEEKFPDNPRVVIAVAQLPEIDWNMKLIEHLTAVDPKNPEWLYQKVRLIGDHNDYDRDAAISVLRQAAALKGRSDNHLVERMQRLRDTSLLLGVGPGDAVRLTLSRQSKYSNLKAMVAAKSALDAELAAVKATGSEDRVREIIGLGLDTADKLSAAPAIGFAEELFAYQLKLDLLERRPDDTMPGASEHPVGTHERRVAGM